MNENDTGLLKETITLEPGYASGYGAIPSFTAADLTVGNITISSGGTSATAYTMSGLGGAMGSNAVWTTNTAHPSIVGSQWPPTTGATLGASGKMELRGEGADIDINGKSMKAWMEKVEDRLNILTPNPELEKEWDELRRLGERYRKLEKKCQEKAEVWKKLKSMPKPEVKW